MDKCNANKSHGHGTIIFRWFTIGLILEDQEDTQKRPFRFYNCLVKHQKIKEKDQAGWHITGDGLKGIWKNLKVIRREM